MKFLGFCYYFNEIFICLVEESFAADIIILQQSGLEDKIIGIQDIKNSFNSFNFSTP
jgi:hypothetical protein